MSKLFIEQLRLDMEYLSVRQTVEKWGIPKRRIHVLCLEGRVEGTIKIDSSRMIPSRTNKPKDERIKTGKYVK